MKGRFVVFYFFKNILVRVLIKLGFKNVAYYINGPVKLPAPLSKEEEEEIFKKLKDNDSNAKDILITHNLRLVVYIAKRFESSGVGVEDLISIGTIGLIKACNTFSPQKNIKLATYASSCIENEILMYLRKAATKKHEMSIDEPLKVDWDGNELLLSDILGTENDCVNKNVEDKAELNVVLDFIEKLEEREKEIMKLRFGMLNGKEYTQKEVADKIGISQSYISRLEKKIIARLRKEMKKNKVRG